MDRELSVLTELYFITLPQFHGRKMPGAKEVKYNNCDVRVEYDIETPERPWDHHIKFTIKGPCDEMFLLFLLMNSSTAKAQDFEISGSSKAYEAWKRAGIFPNSRGFASQYQLETLWKQRFQIEGLEVPLLQRIPWKIVPVCPSYLTAEERESRFPLTFELCDAEGGISYELTTTATGSHEAIKSQALSLDIQLSMWKGLLDGTIDTTEILTKYARSGVGR